MKKINNSGVSGTSLAPSTFTTEDRARVFSMSAEAVAMKRRMEVVFVSSDRDALKPDNGDRRFVAIDLEDGKLARPQVRLHPHQEAAMKDMRKAAGTYPVFKFDLPLLRENLKAVADTGNAQMEFYRTMLGEAWPDANTDASLFGKPDIAIEDVSIEEPMRTLQMREEVDLIAAHLKALPPLPPVPRCTAILVGERRAHKEPGK